MNHGWHNAARCALAWLACYTFACDGGSDARSRLDGRAFLFESAQGFTPVAGTRVFLSFASGEVSISADCNSGSGPYQVRDQRLVVQGLATTERGCEPAKQQQDEWLAAFVTARPLLQLEDSKLTLTGAAATLVLRDREVADPDRPLQGLVWSVDTVIENEAASDGPGGARSPTLLFRPDGSLLVDTACNTGSGRYRVDGDEITLSEVVFTDAACGGPSMFLNDKVQAVVSDGKLEFEIEAARLTLMRGAMGVSATAP